ncbi:MAG: cobalamin biosynthesis protein, partial [Synechococcaceae cyanobacterium SM2_3_60]|nr:cobalamin biosynthesis protein [Synechococcaceae cyanobacterium SM2_3_60]
MAKPLPANPSSHCSGAVSTLAFVALPLALGLDRLLGDPWHWYHPVQAMGWLIARGKHLILRICQKPWQQRGAGGLLTLVLVA